MEISHLSGSANLVSDFSSRNAPECTEESCQICKFITEIDEGVVRNVSIADVINGTIRLPFVGRKSWLANQSECGDLRRVKAHLLQGTRPSKKENHIKDIKRYLGCVTVAGDGLLVVIQTGTVFTQHECIVVPLSLIHI